MPCRHDVAEHAGRPAEALPRTAGRHRTLAGTTRHVLHLTPNYCPNPLSLRARDADALSPHRHSGAFAELPKQFKRCHARARGSGWRTTATVLRSTASRAACSPAPARRARCAAARSRLHVAGWPAEGCLRPRTEVLPAHRADRRRLPAQEAFEDLAAQLTEDEFCAMLTATDHADGACASRSPRRGPAVAPRALLKHSV